MKFVFPNLFGDKIGKKLTFFMKTQIYFPNFCEDKNEDYNFVKMEKMFSCENSFSSFL